MIITEKAIFVHIPKTAGQSIGRAMMGDGMDKFRTHLVNHATGERHPGQNPHLSASAIRKFVGNEHYERAFKFTVIRHPLDRMRSFYVYGQKRLKKGIFYSFDEFAQFVVGEIEKPNAGWGWENARLKMVDLIDDELDAIIHYSNINNWWEDVGIIIGATHSVLPKLNPSYYGQSDLTKYGYRVESIQKLREYFKDDFKRFNYK